MSIGVTAEQRELTTHLQSWAHGVGGREAARAAEGDPAAGFDGVWLRATEQGVPAIALPEEWGGGGGSVLDAAVALEACAHALVPGPLVGTTAAAALLAGADAEGAADAGGIAGAAKALAGGARFAVALSAGLEVGERLTGELPVVADAPGADWLVLGGHEADGTERWFLVPADRADVRPGTGIDLTRRAGAVRVDAALEDLVALPGLTAAQVSATVATFAVAEAAGVARWCLATAVDYAKVREQFGQPIGKFQAIKHLCAEMLEISEAAAAVAWDAAATAEDDPEQWAFAVDVAGTIAFDGAVQAAQHCIQVLGGIGFTFEHEAHLYLRRAIALRGLLGGGRGFAQSLADRAASGVRRRLTVDLAGADAPIRPGIRAAVEQVAAAPEAERRAALVAAGLAAPHWPEPYGRDAGPVEQLVVDEELARAGLALPDLKIGGWAVPTILAHGTDAQRERFVRPTLLGDVVWCQLFSEPGAGSDLASLRTRAVRVEGGWRLTGQKVWTSLAQQAHWGICLARTDAEAPAHRGITYFLVDMTAPGLDIRPLRELTGDALFNEVFLDDVFVPDEHVVGTVNDGWRLARTTLANERVAMAGTKLGVSAERAVELLAGIDDAAERARVGDAVALSTVCALLDVRTTLRSIAGQGPGPESSVAKLLTVRVRQEASELVVDLQGEQVLLDGAISADVHEMLLTRCLSIAGGTTQVLRNVASERILGLPR